MNKKELEEKVITLVEEVAKLNSEVYSLKKKLEFFDGTRESFLGFKHSMNRTISNDRQDLWDCDPYERSISENNINRFYHGIEHLPF